MASKNGGEVAVAYRDKSLGQRFVYQVKRQWPYWVMMAPGLFLIALFCYVTLPGILIAFKDYNAVDGIFGSAWMNPWYKNFEFFFKSDVSKTITFNTLFYNVLEMVTVTVSAVALAILLYEVKNKYLSATYKGAILLPTFLSWIVIQYIVFSLLSTDRGIVNNLIVAHGGTAKEWYATPWYWRIIMPAVYLWKNVGYYSVYYVAAIAGINSDYYEAAQLDGATKWQQVKYITIPMLRPIIIILSLMWVGNLFRGGLGDWMGFMNITNNASLLYPATDVVDTYVYRALKQMYDYGMSTAVGLYQSVIGFVLVMVSNWVIRKIDPDSALF